MKNPRGWHEQRVPLTRLRITSLTVSGIESHHG